MSNRSYAKSQLFLMEFIAVVLFFALCSSICINAFVKANNMSKESKELNHANILAQSAAESIKALEYTNIDQLEELTGLHNVEENKYLGYYDEDFKSLDQKELKKDDKSNKIYVMEVDMTLEHEMLTAQVTVNKKNIKENICKLTVKKYLPVGV